MELGGLPSPRPTFPGEAVLLASTSAPATSKGPVHRGTAGRDTQGAPVPPLPEGPIPGTRRTVCPPSEDLAPRMRGAVPSLPEGLPPPLLSVAGNLAASARLPPQNLVNSS